MTTSSAGASPPERHHRRPRVQRLLGVLLSPSKFAIVGVIGIAVNQVVLFAATEFLGIFYLVSVVIASQVSTLNNFVLTEAWVFHLRESRHGAVFRYLVFNALNTATLLVRLPVVYLLTDRFGINYLVSNLIAIGLTFGVRYFVADNWIWAGRDQQDQVARGGSYNYDVHGIIKIRSAVNLPELAAFNVDREVDP
ncbi:MAG: GtrA family protein, partial [Candidatus Limnocylindrales bacterium]